MISKREILDIAAKLNLNPHVVEKDYALGWALAGIFARADLSESWVFKGGTCLKKCHFETYRFSEDLDFTLQDPSHLDESFLRPVFADIAAWIYDRSGLEFAADRQNFDIYKNPRGNLNCEGKLSYRGPVSPTAGGWPRIKLDLTADERLVLPPIRTPNLSSLRRLSGRRHRSPRLRLCRSVWGEGPSARRAYQASGSLRCDQPLPEHRCQAVSRRSAGCPAAEVRFQRHPCSHLRQSPGL